MHTCTQTHNVPVVHDLHLCKESNIFSDDFEEVQALLAKVQLVATIHKVKIFAHLRVHMRGHR